MPPLKRVFKAFWELGWRQSGQYGLYLLGKRAGLYRLYPRPPAFLEGDFGLNPGSMGPERDDYAAFLGENAPGLLDSAARILNGQVSVFGGLETGLDLAPPAPLRHWTHHDYARIGGRDIKLTWEPARFGWAITLARAYCLTGDPAYPDFFYRQVRVFQAENPPYRGPHWANGQEVALRLTHMACTHLVFGWQAPGLYHTLALHAHRLPATLVYARAQRNNHLLSEAAGLMTAGLVLEGHPRAAGWIERGWSALNRGLQDQIDPHGAYIQQSANYHRLMLSLALWGGFVAHRAGLSYPPATRSRLAAATAWLLALCDPNNGRLPNLGPNDGAYILPFSACPFHDFRPVLQAAARAFLGEAVFPPGPWDEMSDWLASPHRAEGATPGTGLLAMQHPDLPGRAFLRAARFHGRPGHADQLHLDLWWRGQNIAMDPGTYHYNAEPPWENALRTALHHNTLTVDGRDQMTPAGRFLYLDPARARVLAIQGGLAAEHDGYRRLGLTHRRTLEAPADGWRVIDEVFAAGEMPAGREPALRLHWLLPDFPWKELPDGLALHTPMGRIEVHLETQLASEFHLSLVRAGEFLLGGGPAAPTLGWFSPTYALKEPALSLVLETRAPLPFRFITTWRLIPAP